MVQYNWKKLAPTPASPDGGFWATASDRVGDIKSEFTALEDLFGAKKAAQKPEGGMMSPTMGGAEDGKKTAVTLLDFKRVQALSILLSRLKMSNEEIRTAILSLDTSKISPEDLKNLAKNAPTPDEIEMLKSYPDDPSTLAKPEQFFLAIMDIPRLTAKLEGFIFVQKFASQAEELKPDLEVLNKACNQLKTSKKFAKILELVLALGNFVNGGTFRGGFSGFKLDSILALADVKSTADPKLSLLHYFARLLREKYPDLLNFYDELSALETAKRVSLQTIAGEVGGLRKGLKATAAEAEGSKNDGLDIISRSLDSALSRITPQFDALDAELGRATTAFNEVVAFFGEDPKTSTPEEFFSIVARFHASLEQVHKDAANEKERVEKEAKRAAAARARGNSRAPRMAGLDPAEAPEATNIMDNLLSDLKSDTMKDTIKAHRSKIHTKGAPPPIGGPPNPMVAAEAMTVVLRKTGGPKSPLPPTPTHT